jgi:hypothetical protein
VFRMAVFGFVGVGRFQEVTQWVPPRTGWAI